jgi:hypothetical protein
MTGNTSIKVPMHAVKIQPIARKGPQGDLKNSESLTDAARQ